MKQEKRIHNKHKKCAFMRHSCTLQSEYMLTYKWKFPGCMSLFRLFPLCKLWKSSAGKTKFLWPSSYSNAYFLDLSLFIILFFWKYRHPCAWLVWMCVQHVHASDSEQVGRVIEERCTRRGSTERYGGNGKKKNGRMGNE